MVCEIPKFSLSAHKTTFCGVGFSPSDGDALTLVLSPNYGRLVIVVLREDL
jgi:hypothetical protein